MHDKSEWFQNIAQPLTMIMRAMAKSSMTEIMANTRLHIVLIAS